MTKKRIHYWGIGNTLHKQLGIVRLRLITVLAVLLCITVLSGCGNSPEKQAVGTWYLENSNYEDLILNKNGRFTWGDDTEYGKWRVDDNSILYLQEDNGTDEYTYDMYMISDGRMVLVTDRANVDTYYRKGKNDRLDEQSSHIGDISWEIDSNGELTISGSGDMENYYSESAPWNPERKRITSIKISDGITSIGDHAFDYLYQVDKVDIPSSVTHIGEYAFEYCQGLTDITIPSKVVSIGEGAFLRCNTLKNVELSDGLEYISERAFEECYAIEQIRIPKSIKFIEPNAFYLCASLSDVYYSKSEKDFEKAVSDVGNNIWGASLHYNE